MWETCARLNIPVFIHMADPPEFFQPLDYNNERWLELALYPDRRYQTGVPLRGADDRARTACSRKHPNTQLHPGAYRVARATTWRGSARCSTRSRTCTPKSARCSTTSAASRGRRTSSSSSTRTGFCSARTAISPTNIRTTGACSRPTTSTSTTTATTTRSGSCTASACRTRC